MFLSSYGKNGALEPFEDEAHHHRGRLFDGRWVERLKNIPRGSPDFYQLRMTPT